MDSQTTLMCRGKGKEVRLSFGMHSTVVPRNVVTRKALLSNRNGLVVILELKAAYGEGCTKPEVAKEQLDELSDRGFDPQSVGGDKGYR